MRRCVEATAVMSALRHLHVSVPRLLAAVALLAVGVALVALDGPSPDPIFVVVFVLAVGFFLVSAFDSVRAHEGFTLAQATWTALVFGLLVAAGNRGLFFTALAALAGLGALVEAYNYVAGTSHLRIE